MEQSVLVALIGFGGTIVVGAVTVVVAVMNNKRERSDTADKSIEATLRERILLRDEKLEEVTADLARANATNDVLREEVKRKDLRIEELLRDHIRLRGKANNSDRN